jgi:hypothetical protein
MKIFFTAVILAVALAPLIYIGNFAGDSQVHLIYGQNAADGDFFEFNEGEKSPGVSSPGYMLLLASFFRMAPETWVPAVVKLVNILFWYGLLIVFFLIARRLSGSTVWASIATLAAGLLPGSVYNSTIGMENGIFGFLIMLWVYLAMRSGWFKSASAIGSSWRSELALGAVMGVACWVRPEGFVVAAIALSYRALLSLSSRPVFAVAMARSAVFLAPFLVLTIGLGYFHYSQSGYLLPASGLSRILMSNIAADSWQIGPLFFSTKFTVRLLQYFPLTIFSFVGTWLLLRGSGGFSRESRDVLWFLVLLFWIFFILYSTVLGSVHLSRYVIFTMPGLALLAMVGAKWVWDHWYIAGGLKLAYGIGAMMAAFAFALGGVFIIETELRLRLDSQASLWKTIRAPKEREVFSDALFRQLGEPEMLPINIGLQEVQVRYWLDRRFVVRSLDGRVDPTLLDHATRDGVDLVGYIKDRDIAFLLATPNYNRDRALWSLKELNRLNPGESLEHRGLTFSRLPVDRTVPETTQDGGLAQSRWFADTGGIPVLLWFLNNLIRVDHGGPGR